MAYRGKRGWLVGLAVGLLVGWAVGALLPDTPLHAVATDRTDGFAMATGFVDDGVEAVYFLDFLTGSLNAAVLSNQTPRFQALYGTNVNADLANMIQARSQNLTQTNMQRRKQGLPPLPAIQMPQNPNYLMVTGAVDIRRGASARVRPAAAALYVAETTTGMLLVYLIPWEQTAHQADRPSGGTINLLTAEQVTTAIVQTE
jgi:hypothetical protein